MANGSVYIDLTNRNEKGMIFTMGRMLVGNADVVRAPDVGMNQIKSLVITPFSRTPVGSIANARIIVAQGSLGSVTSIGSANYASVRMHALDSYSAAGSIGIGTLPTGSIRASYFAAGQ
jgi:hypothetical protein